MPCAVLLVGFIMMMMVVCTEAKASAADLPQKCVTVGEFERCWYTYTPASVASAPGPVPLVINMHGFSASGEDHVGQMGWDVLAETEGFIVVWPDGHNTAWNAGSCCGDVIDSVRSKNPTMPRPSTLIALSSRCQNLTLASGCRD